MVGFKESCLSHCHIIDIPTFTDARGSITIAEEKQLSFVSRRVFWLHHIASGMARGSHALTKSSEMMVAVHGRLTVSVFDGVEKFDFVLDNSSKGLYIPSGIWFTAHSFSEDAVCLVIASSEYSEDEYLNDYDRYLRLKLRTID